MHHLLLLQILLILPFCIHRLHFQVLPQLLFASQHILATIHLIFLLVPNLISPPPYLIILPIIVHFSSFPQVLLHLGKFLRIIFPIPLPNFLFFLRIPIIIVLFLFLSLPSAPILSRLFSLLMSRHIPTISSAE